MKATVRVLISVLALVVASAVTAPAAQAQSPTTQRASAAAVVTAPTAAGAVVSVPPARIADSRDGVQIPGAVAALSTAGVRVTGRGGIQGPGKVIGGVL